MEENNVPIYEHVNHPDHYNDYDVEVIEMMRRIWGDNECAIFCKLSAFKYRMRMGHKPTEPIERDLKKEDLYLKKYKELTLDNLGIRFKCYDPFFNEESTTLTDTAYQEQKNDKQLLCD